MCGIFGTINYPVAVPEDEVYAHLQHRGPDEQGSFVKKSVSLYHTRLAIQDLSANGKQPMQYRGMVITFNGEIYNHLELRKKYGLEAESNSDTLTILMLYELMGMKMLQELEGMFAFSLYDEKNAVVYLARDRAGKKPLYVYNNHKAYVFSSSLNLIYKVCKPDLDYGSLAACLYIGHHYRKDTPYTGVEELENGHYLKIHTGGDYSENVRWFNMAEAYQKNHELSYRDTELMVDMMLNQAVRRRMESSDLSVGSFLSGGIDSGIVTAMAAGHTAKLKTFTVRVEGSFDESAIAARVAEKFDTDHTVVDIDFNHLEQDIEQILSNHGEPTSDNSAIPSYYVAKEAKKHITVVLNGDGADELFAGYRRYVPFRHFDFFNQGNLTRKTAAFLAASLPVAHQKISGYTYMYRLLKFASYEELSSIYCSSSADLFVGLEDQFVQQPRLGRFRDDLKEINAYPISSLKKVMLMDFESMLCGRLLPKMDIATMAHSLEGRSPFLCKELLDFVPGMQDNFKVRNFNTKDLLRGLARQYLPPQVSRQPKRGFEIPLQGWLDNQLKDIIGTYLYATDALYPKIVKRTFITDLLEKRILISSERRAKILFAVFSLEVWYKNLPQ